MLSPKKFKFRKQHKGRIHGNGKGWHNIGIWRLWFKGIIAEPFTSRQIEAARRAITRHLRRQGKVWIRIFPDVPVTKKPLEVRQGKGKGSVEFWAARVKPGRIMFELDGVSPEMAREAFDLAAMKLPVKTKFISALDHNVSKRLKRL